jgi:predicted esterase YcpF (UPF0227 family)
MIKTINIECTGYSVVADFYNGKTEDKVLLVLIGWTSNRESYSDIITALTEQTGMSALVFDYSGHGDSPFNIANTRPAQHFLEVICVFDWLKKHYPSAEINVMGTSYGGYLASQLTKYREFNNLILRVPAIYLPSDFYTLNSEINSDAGWATNNSYRNDPKSLAIHPLLAGASKFKGRVLVVVNEKDEQVPNPTTDAYIKAFNADVYLVKGFPHSIQGMPRDQINAYQTKLADWLNG